MRRCRDENMSQRGWAPGPRLSSPGERERHTAMSGGAEEVNMLQFCSVSNPLSHTNLSNKVRGIFFLELCRSFLLLRQYVFCMYMCIVVLCGYTAIELNCVPMLNRIA